MRTRTLLVGLLALASAAGAQPVRKDLPAAAPALVLWRSDQIEKARQRLRSGDASLRPAYDALIADAQRAMTAGPWAVTDKQLLPPSGDKRDYQSFGPYWWPDSTKPNGLPFIRRDGVVNAVTRASSDSPRLYALTDAVETLALAHYFSGEARYAQRAGMLLRRFFLDSATGMRPHLRYGQAIPGVSEGRGIGIIDTRELARVADAVRLLRGTPGWTDADERGLQTWMRSFLEWLRTSEHGKDEADEPNNHGIWYDAQLAGVALFVGDTAVVREIATRTAPARLAAQIAADGGQPEELARTRPLHYSIFNLEAMARIAETARAIGVDVWRWSAPSGASLRGAFAFVAPYADPANAWKGAQVGTVSPDSLILPLRRAAHALGDPSLLAPLAKLPAARTAAHRSRLLYPDVTAGAAPRAGAATASPLDTLADRALAFAQTQMRRSVDAMDPRDGWPRHTQPDGTWDRRGVVSWTNGFFPGTMWYLYEHTKDPYWRTQAERWTTRLDTVAKVTTTHDLGFVLFDSFGHQWRLTQDARAKAVLLEGSATLARRFAPAVGAIKSWDVDNVTDRRRQWEGGYPVIVDNLMNLEMLFWAAANGGDPGLKALAERHALTSMRAHLRDDGSAAHVALFDPQSGRMLRRVTWQGANDSSAWARGQAWAIYGLGAAARETGNAQLLAGARRAAEFFIAHLPAEGVPFWDFRHPGIPNTERDASAAAIAASGLLELATIVDPPTAARYRGVAARMLTALARDYTAAGRPERSILVHTVGDHPQHREIDVGMVYSDYYFVEALLRWKGWRAAGGR
ncbi:MAG: alginate lyase family protein [Gemmatirosa sp.]